MRLNPLLQLSVFVLLCLTGGNGLAADKLAGDALKRHVAGKRIYLAAPGGEFPLHYRQSGIVDGSGEAIGLGKFLAPKDKGRWWVEGENLCQKWEQWYDGKTFCFTVRPTGEKTINWVRDDGMAGTARIVD